MTTHTETHLKPETPIPWKVGKQFDHDVALHNIYGPEGELIAKEVGSQDSAYAIRSCNSFPALLAALEEARNDLDEAATYLSLRNLGEPARVLFGKLTVATARTHAAIAAAKAP